MTLRSHAPGPRSSDTSIAGRRQHAATAVAVLLSACLAGGCAVQAPTYHWGRYEELLYDMYRRPGKADPAQQIALLNEDIDRAHGRGRAVPPGVHAHLGYMLYLQGNLEAAQREFETESRLYPESAVFMQRLLAGSAGTGTTDTDPPDPDSPDPDSP